ncbi:MAG: Smr/MutS family protein [Deltaproteobacteria bacterium]|nr:Smr/MutS family protein [Deltaproteobacteria bacterium]
MTRKDKQRESSRVATEELAAKKAANNPAPLAAKGLKGLESLKAEFDAKARAEQAAIEERAQKEAAFRKQIGLKAEPTKVKKLAEAPTRKTDVIEVWRPDLDAELFAASMRGVKPLAPEKNPHRGPRPAKRQNEHSGAVKARRDSAQGDVGLVVSWGEDGLCRACRKGGAFALEMLQRFEGCDAVLDLHGQDVVQARARTQSFVRAKRELGLRTVEIIHGTGKHSPDGECILRDVVVSALTDPSFSREIDAFAGRKVSKGPSPSVFVALRAR